MWMEERIELGYVGLTTYHLPSDADKKLHTIDCPSSGASDCWKGSLDNAGFLCIFMRTVTC